MFVRSKLLDEARFETANLRAEVSSLQSALESERGRRISAETLVVERGKIAEQADERAKRFEAAFVEALGKQMHSLDTVNMALLSGIATEQTTNVSRETSTGERLELRPPRHFSQFRKDRNKQIQDGIKRISDPLKRVQ